MPNPVYRGGDQAVVYYAPETVAYPMLPFAAGFTAPAQPGSPVLAGYFNPSSRRVERANKKGYGGGSPFALYNARGVRTFTVGINVRIGNPAILQYCLRSTVRDVLITGIASNSNYKGLPDLCLYIGAANTYGDGNIRCLRYCKCSSLTLNFREDTPEITADATFIGLYQEAGSAASPSISALRSWGDALTWGNVITVLAGSTQLRDLLSGINITLNNNIEGKGVLANHGDNLTTTDQTGTFGRSLTHNALRPGTQNVSAELSFHTDIPVALIDAAATSLEWGDVVISSTNAAAGASVPTIMTTTLKGCLLTTNEDNAVDPSAELTTGCSVVADDLIIAAA